PAFSDALDHAKELVEFEPEAIETLDGTILGLAKSDIIYRAVEGFLTPGNGKVMQVGAINLVEFVADGAQELDGKEQALGAALKDFEYHLVNDEKDIAALWELRKRSVGLLGKVPGTRKPVSGVEDTVVPPEHLAEYVKEFRAILDGHGLEYGMFGHVDVGCLHVRPAFNLMEEGERQTYYDIIGQVAELTHKYGGVLWGEHGKGFRSEFVPTFFGDELYGEMRKIKSACDPYNQLNPGKIAIPVDSDTELANIRSRDTRAAQNSQIRRELRAEYELPLTCNGNGACFDYDRRDVMCPSYKITRDRRHSPKGRASLVREWVRQVSLAGSKNASSNSFSRLLNTVRKRRGQYDFSHEVYAAMEGCLGCQACKSQCPVNVDVPSFRARFMEAYHFRYARSPRQLLVAYSERMGYYQSRFPRANNIFLSNALVKWSLAKFAGFVDPPQFSSPNLKTRLKRNRIPWLDLDDLPDKDKSVVLVQDWVTSLYEAGLVVKVCRLIQRLGYEIYVLPRLENGKTFHVEGMLKTFGKLVQKNAPVLQKVADHGLPMVGLDPAMVLSFRYEYRDYVDRDYDYDVMLLQEWLAEVVSGKEISTQPGKQTGPFYLLSHCTETANCDQSQAQWRCVFDAFGLKLRPRQAGCCGMAGAYGHETMHIDQSRGLFELSWKQHFEDEATAARQLVDGFSCRTQVGRYTGRTARHPVEVLLEAME
ncbi:MAG TPA: FAD-linked oxidase C-terminal domain-containing protein, partial [Gammaproteobacteria bacterium]|nr:FAD-linked oxidase C-terminal domain-containing protein [Gammaproteobacteria bacterium]